MFSNKKGDLTWEQLTALIIVAIIFGIMLWFTIQAWINGNQISRDETCKASVQANARRLEFAGTELTAGLSDLKCPTEKITIKDPSNIQLSLANQMYYCWDKFGKGKIKFLPASTETYCIICSKVSFTEEAKGKKVNNFIKYLAETRVRDDNGNPISGINYTYLKYLSDYETTPEILDKIKATQTDNINTDLDYAVMFLYYKQNTLGRPGLATKTAIYGVAGCFTSSVAVAAIVIISGGAGAVVLPAAGAIFSGCSGLMAPLGATAGFVFGSDSSADWGARILTTPYQNIDQLGCTALEGGGSAGTNNFPGFSSSDNSQPGSGGGGGSGTT
jgi:hypothetical protein